MSDWMNEIAYKKRFLMTYSNAIRRLRAVEEDFDRLRLMRMSASAMLSDGMPHAGGISDLSDYIVGLDEILSEHIRQGAWILKARKLIAEAVNALPTETEISILTYRFLTLQQTRYEHEHGLPGTRPMSLDEVAKKMDYSYPQTKRYYWRAMKHLVIPQDPELLDKIMPASER